MRAAHLAGLALVASMSAGCELLLVGGQCEAGYVEREGGCVADQADGGAGQGADAAAGAGTSVDGGGGSPPARGGAGGAGASGSGGDPGSGGAGGGIDCGPLELCGSECVDVDNDPLHCGECNHGCQTGLCGGGQCQGQFAGHVAALGFDYGAVGAGTSAARILGNAVYLHPHEPVSVTIYTRSAASVVTDKVSALIVAEGSLRGRSASISLIDDATALATTASGLATDVIIVPPQPDAEPGDMPDAASLWATPLTDFASQGGVLLFLVHGQSSADLLGASDFLGEVVVAAEPMQSLVISSWIDALSVGVLSPFASNHGTYSVTATGPADAMQQVVVSTGAGAPIVVHRVLAPAP